jgi:hypothetical protein
VTLDLAAVGADDFEPHLGSTFEAVGPDGSVALVLDDVCRGRGGPMREQFTLTFAVTQPTGSSPLVPQGIVHLEHEGLGGFDLFVVPIGPGPDGRHRYEAVFA